MFYEQFKCMQDEFLILINKKGNFFNEECLQYGGSTRHAVWREFKKVESFPGSDFSD